MYLSVLRYIFKSRSKRGLFDLNKKAEPFFKHLLNLTYGWDLDNLNAIQANYPAIDLGDENSRVCVQVTAERSSSKIKKTINKYLNKKLFKSYDRLIILILTEKKSYSTEFETKTKFNFDASKDIIDIDDLLSDIEDLELDKLEEIHDYLQRELSTIVKLFADKGSLLSQIPEFSGVKPTDSIGFFKYLELSGEELEEGKNELLSLYNKLKTLSKRSREYLYLLIERANIETTIGVDRLYALPADIESYSGLTRSESREEFQVLEANKLVYYESEDYPPRIEIFFPMNIDVDLFMMLREYLNDSKLLQRIIVDCDFSILNS